MELTTIWFSLIAILWIGYFTLEGFDFGVGMLLPILGRNEKDRRVMINTIGPVWDGNEVWVLVAGGATFAAFPEWYATLFSGFYLPLLLILVALIVRGLAFEYRGKRDDDTWRARWDLAIIVGSYVPALLWGVAFANILRGVPIDADMEYVGGFFNLLNPYALLGGLTTLMLFITHGAVFISLKTDGPIRAEARALAMRLGLGAAVVTVAFLVWTQLDTGTRRLGGGVRAGRGRAGRRPARHPRRPRGLGVHRDVRGDRARRGRALPRPLPGRDADLAVRRRQPDDDQRLRDRLHAEDHDRRGADLHADRARLPGVDLLGLPQADQRPPHPGPGRRACRRRRRRQRRGNDAGLMRPFDPRIRQQLAPARRPLLGVVAAGVGGSLLLITQAWVVTGLVVAVVEGDPIGAWLVAVAAVFVLRAGPRLDVRLGRGACRGHGRHGAAAPGGRDGAAPARGRAPAGLVERRAGRRWPPAA